MLWYVDRSRFEDGNHICQILRYLAYHFGPSGYGIARRAQSLPLATGLGYHEGLEGLGLWAQAHPDAHTIPENIIRDVALAAGAMYKTRALKSGIAQVADPDRLIHVIEEQRAFIVGQTWCLGLEFFPWLLEQYEVVGVEEEGVLVLDCTCGLGDRVGTDRDHNARGCQGIGFMSRPDLITKSRSRPDSHQYWEGKGTSYYTPAWGQSWETKIQFQAGIVAHEALRGIRIDETYVIGLLKGKREKNKDGLPEQRSPLCYGYQKPAVPPLTDDEWAPEYKWTDEDGRERRLGTAFQRQPIWTQTFDAGVDPVEYWVKWIGADVRQRQLAIVGPFNRQTVQIDTFFRDLVPHERRWQQGCWELYEALQAHGWQWSAPAVEAVLSEHFTHSWNCQKFGSDYSCSMKGICFKRQGWEEPLSMVDEGGEAIYVLRRPHHAAELAQAVEAGVEIPAAEDIDGDD